MKILPKKHSSLQQRLFETEIKQALANPGIEGRVCDNCTFKCEDCGSISCQCMCKADCPDLPARISADPEHFPIEPGIVPLVFEMKKDGTCTPCWSCEGHNNPDGSLWKIPRVWFYCSSMVHLRLIERSIHGLHTAKSISAPWQVVVTHSDPDNTETTFSLEPSFPPGLTTRLEELQADVLVIANAWSDFLKCEARSLSRSFPDQTTP